MSSGSVPPRPRRVVSVDTTKSNTTYVHLIALAVAQVIGIVALVLTVVQSDQINAGQANVRATTLLLSANDSATTQQLSLLQSRWAEIAMDVNQQFNVTHNETILVQGTFLWSVGVGLESLPSWYYPDGLIGVTCPFDLVGGYSVVTAGTGYQVGDLITNLELPSDLISFNRPFVLRVDAVNDTDGAVTQFTMLTPGCFVSDAGTNTTINTQCIRGSGFTVKRWATVSSGYGSNYYWNNGFYSQFDAPIGKLLAPLQYANFTMKQVTVADVVFNVLELDPPEYRMAIHDTDAPFLRFSLFRFRPVIPDLRLYQGWPHPFPLTQRNLDALDLEEYDNTCYREQNPDVCLLKAEAGGSARYYKNTINLASWNGGNSFNVQWAYRSYGDVHNYALNGTTFSLRRPLLLHIIAL